MYVSICHKKYLRFSKYICQKYWALDSDNNHFLQEKEGLNKSHINHQNANCDYFYMSFRSINTIKLLQESLRLHQSTSGQ